MPAPPPVPAILVNNNPEYGVGPVALAGLALLEGGVPVNDQSLKNITEAVRDASFGQTKTYQIALCLMYLDRLGDSADVPIIQMLAVRLLAGQNSNGGWGYSCVQGIPAADLERLKGLKQGQLVAGGNGGGGKDPPKLHPEVEKYAQSLANAKNQGGM